MGIPKFYRWLSERYPLLNQPCSEDGIPPIDNLYLDMNGILHTCTHGNDDGEVVAARTEEEMVRSVLEYLDRIIHIVSPEKLVLMAVDGVAPRAKMNQQRARRFKAAKEARDAAEEAARLSGVPGGAGLGDGSTPPPGFSSNAITPGTPFMARMDAHIKFFVRHKQASGDPAWSKPRVVVSGHDVPGEGEHKIMEYLRWERSQRVTKERAAARAGAAAPDASSPIRHCLYGLDADLIVLALVTHEPNFLLLREVVNFGPGGRGQPSRAAVADPSADGFVLFQIGLLREYIDLEFGPQLRERLPFDYSLERVLDDLMLIVMLVGNDFLPTLPTLDIAEGSADLFFGLYARLLPTLGGYVTSAGRLHRGRLEVFLSALALNEGEALEERAKLAEKLDGGGRRGRRGASSAPRASAQRHPPTPAPAPLAEPWADAGEWEDPAGFVRAEAEWEEAGGRRGAGARPASSSRPGTGASEPPGDDTEAEGSATEAETEGTTEVETTAGSDESERDDDESFALAMRGLAIGAPALPGRPVASAPRAAAGAPRRAARGPGSRPGSTPAPAAVAPPEDADVEPAAAAAGARPTMMSEENRRLFQEGGQAGLEAWKAKYYEEKLGARTAGERRRVSEEYVVGLHWVLEYYYRGVASWSWFYPYHYAPMASELVDQGAGGLPGAVPTFELGEPFTPYQQLLSVQPSDMAWLLPEPYRPLMTNPSSPIADFYPREVALDAEGKRQEWEAVVLTPFIDAARLLLAAASVTPAQLSEEEKRRNVAGDMVVFSTAAKGGPGPVSALHARSTLPNVFKDVRPTAETSAVRVPPPPTATDGVVGFGPGFASGAGRLAKGFPTLLTLSVTARLEDGVCAVFGRKSRRESLVLTVDAGAAAEGGPGAPAPAATAASVPDLESLLASQVFENWPYVTEARVVAVSRAGRRVGAKPTGKPRAIARLASGGGKARGGAADAAPAPPARAALPPQDAAQAAEALLSLHGVRVAGFGPGSPVLLVRRMTGFVRLSDGTLRGELEPDERAVPAALVLTSGPSSGTKPRAVEAAAASLALPAAGERVVLALGPYRGSAGVAVRVDAERGVADLDVEPVPQARVRRLAAAAARLLGDGDEAGGGGGGAAAAERYRPGGHVARRLNVSPSALGRLAGSFWIRPEGGERVDVGLCVRHAGKGLGVPGIAWPTSWEAAPDAGASADAGAPTASPAPRAKWGYSEAFLSAALAYKARFPGVWAAADRRVEEGEASLEDAFPDSTGDDALVKLGELRTFLKALPFARRPLVPWTAQVVSDEALAAFLEVLERGRPAGPPHPLRLSGVPATWLLRPALARGVRHAAAGGRRSPGDRVVSVRPGGVPPIGSPGTVVASYGTSLEVLFDDPFPGGTDLYGRVPRGRGLHVLPSDVVSLDAAATPIAPDDDPDLAPLPAPLLRTFAEMARKVAGVAVSGVASLAELPPDAVAPARGRPEGRAAPRAPAPARAAPVAPAPGPAAPPSPSAAGFAAGRGAPRAAPAPSPPGGRPANSGVLLLSKLKGGGAAPGPRAPGEATPAPRAPPGPAAPRAPAAPATTEGGPGASPNAGLLLLSKLKGKPSAPAPAELPPGAPGPVDSDAVPPPPLPSALLGGGPGRAPAPTPAPTRAARAPRDASKAAAPRVVTLPRQSQRGVAAAPGASAKPAAAVPLGMGGGDLLHLLKKGKAGGGAQIAAAKPAVAVKPAATEPAAVAKPAAAEPVAAKPAAAVDSADSFWDRIAGAGK